MSRGDRGMTSRSSLSKSVIGQKELLQLNKEDENIPWKNFDEVNAWANYQTTAQQARPIDASRHRDRHVANLLQRSRHGDQAVQKILQESNQFDEERTPDSLDFARFFHKSSSQHFHIEGQISADLPARIKKAIEDTFNVYFQRDFQDAVQEKQRNAFMGKHLHFYGTMPWLQPWIVSSLPFPDVFLFIELSLRGVGQVFFQNSPLSGLLMLVGLYWQSSRVATHGVISLLSGNMVALTLGFDIGLIRSGLFGYDAVLVGLCFATFHTDETHSKWTLSIPVTCAIYGSFSSVLFVVMGKLLVPYKAPPLTLPFCFASLMFLSGTANMPNIRFASVVEPALPIYNADTSFSFDISLRAFVEGVIRSIGQVFFADKIISGILIFTGIAVCSRICAIAALIGAIIGSLVSLLVGTSADAIERGLFGFSTSLTVTGIFLFYVPSNGTALLATMAAIMTSLVQQTLTTLFGPYGLPVLTLPFCVIALPFLILQGTTDLMIAVPLEEITIPEDHLIKVRMLRKGFGYLETILESQHKSRTKSMSGVVKRKLRKAATNAFVRSPQKFSTTPANNRSSRKSSFCKSAAKNQDEIIVEMFEHMLPEGNEEIRVEDFVASLRGAGLNSTEGLRFAILVLLEMDMDDSGSIDKKEFLALCSISQSIHSICHDIARFCHFVDRDCNQAIDLEEIDTALRYIGEDILTEDERSAIVLLMGMADKDSEIDIVEFIDQVTIANIKNLVSSYQDETMSK